MARKERKASANPEVYTGSQGAENLGLPKPYGSAPLHAGAYCLYISKNNGRNIVIFAAIYAAKKYLDILLGDDDVSLTKGITGQNDTLVSSTGITVRCDKIKEIWDHEYTSKEEQWELGEPDASNAARFRANSHELRERSPENDNDSKDKPSREVREKKESKPKVDKTGLITIQQICDEIKMEPREARGILRKTKTQKPAVGWAWDKSQVDAIKTLLHNNK